MGKYEDMIDEINQYTEFNDVTVECHIRDINDIKKCINKYNEKYDTIISNLNTISGHAKAQYRDKINKRRNFVNSTMNEIKTLLSSIKDAHYHRMEEKYSHDELENHISVIGLSEKELMDKATCELGVLRGKIGGINQAFVPSGMSNVIGSVLHTYRKRTYLEIIRSKNRILDYIEPLIDTGELKRLIDEADKVYNSRVAEEKKKLNDDLASIPMLEDEKRRALLEKYNRGLEILEEQTELFKKHNITMGAYVYNTSFGSFFSESNLDGKEGVAISNEQIAFAVGFNSLRNNYVYMNSQDEGLQKHFISLAIDLLSTDINNEVIFVDVKGLGSGYSILNKLTESGHVSIWSTYPQVSQGLDALEIRISNIYIENLADKYASLEDYNSSNLRKKAEKYLFINDIKGNIEQKDYEKLIRIIKNGRRAGVYVIGSVSEKDINDKHFCELYSEILTNIQLIKTSGLVVHSTNNSDIMLKYSVERSKIDALYYVISDKEKNGEIIPLEKYLPAKVNEWHTLSSAREIVIPFGIDSNGRVAKFKISAEKPYGMIIGDPRHGKSKLMHSIIMMITSNYSEEEVKIAVMDLKDGAEFNVYAKAGIKPIECVLNDEDPDAMLSFLRYYVSEMHRRQELFEQLEDRTGVIIQKYEDYRSTNYKIGNIMPAMPRLVLLIDEFQTLFDGSASAIYMSELVRKGATYGIHVILSSQRAVSSNPRNGFTMDLKDYFTSRFVFKCPQAAARSVLSERCADTGRENSGILKASLLSKGHVIFNSYMGQNECDNCEVQCFYPSPAAVSKFVEVLRLLKGGGNKVLFRKNAKSELNASPADGCVYLGNSVRVHHDVATGSCDYIKDDMTVAFSLENELRNMIIAGTDLRCVDSLLISLKHYAEVNSKSVNINLFGRYENINVPDNSNKFRINKYKEIETQINAMQNINNTSEITVNLLIEPDEYAEYSQSAGGLKKNPGVDVLRQMLVSDRNMFTVIYTKNFRNLRNSLQYVIAECPIRLATVGDAENIRMATSENVRIGMGDFDIPKKDAVKAYYYNKNTEKYGKIIMYHKQ